MHLTHQECANLYTQLISLRELKQLEIAKKSREDLELSFKLQKGFTAYNLVNISKKIQSGIKEWDKTPLGLLLERIVKEIEADKDGMEYKEKNVINHIPPTEDEEGLLIIE